MAEQFIIHGGRHLKGTIEARGAKNACFPILAATLLTDQECVIDNVPLIEDIFCLIEILNSLGKETSWIKKRTLRIRQRSRLDAKKINQKLVSKLRGSVLLLGPLLVRGKRVRFAQPGGCVIGVRSISTHLDAFSQLGVKIGEEVTERAEYFRFEFKNKPADEVIMNEFSVTATENAFLFASAIPKKTIIKAADCDYSTQELVKFLNKMGADIKAFGSHNFSVIGRKKLSGARHKILNDPIEAGTFILMAAATRSDITVENVEISYLEFPLKRLKDFGLPLEIIGKDKVRIKPWASFKMGKVQAMPYPGMPTDLLPLFGVLATQTEGMTLLHDPLYDGRLRYLNELNKMGAQIIFADPHRAIVNGPTVLRGVTVDSPDLRGGASLIVGALLAKGETVINNIYQIDRGYERIEERLQKLGADIKRVKN